MQQYGGGLTLTGMDTMMVGWWVEVQFPLSENALSGQKML